MCFECEEQYQEYLNAEAKAEYEMQQEAEMIEIEELKRRIEELEKENKKLTTLNRELVELLKDFQKELRGPFEYSALNKYHDKEHCIYCKNIKKGKIENPEKKHMLFIRLVELLEKAKGVE
ncbi:hypothetical protein [Caloranaerobacter sp. DY30410]|uniref:hypothetical protein n=1 Tax=Caloranaerobacter sp. DY30410 TaxID=3238305 RepID=UPI003D04443A